MDCRREGGLSEDVGDVKGRTFSGQITHGLNNKPNKLLFRDVFLDTAQLADIVKNMPGMDASRVGACGGSQGGSPALACASLEPRNERLSSTFPFLCDYHRVWEMDLATNAYQELHDYFRLYDPLHKREDGIFTRPGYIDVASLSARIRGRVRMVRG